VTVRAALYNVRSPRAPLDEREISLPLEGDDRIPIRFEQLVDSLLGQGQPTPPLGGRHPFATVQAYLAGTRALSTWDLPEARRRFGEAFEREPGYDAAALRYAQSSAWLEAHPAEWLPAAEAAATGADLTPAERSHGAALVALGQGRPAEACPRYRALVRADSMDVAAWWGLGECQARDDRVLPDGPGWRFRSSFEDAARAYLRALELVPSASQRAGDMMVDRLTRVLFTMPGQYRAGWSAGPDSQAFAAYPALDADTVRFDPVPFEALFADSASEASARLALERSRRRLDDLSRSWVLAFPESGAAWTARASALETAGRLTDPGGASALESIRQARRLATDSAATLAPATTEVRILVKAGAWRAARLLVDSLLQRPPLRSSEALRVAPLAGLVGRRRAMVDLLERELRTKCSSASPANGSWCLRRSAAQPSACSASPCSGGRPTRSRRSRRSPGVSSPPGRPPTNGAGSGQRFSLNRRSSGFPGWGLGPSTRLPGPECRIS